MKFITKDYDFKFTYAELDTMIEALSSYLCFLNNRIKFSNGDPKLIEESVAYDLYHKFLKISDEAKEV